MTQTITSETQTRFLQLRIDSLEKHLLDIHNSFASYVSKIAKTRDEADLLATNILAFAQSEQINTGLKTGLNNFANSLNAIQDFRDEEVKKLEEKVINDLSIYGENTRKAKEELKTNSNARNKQLSDFKDGKLREMVRSKSFNEVSDVLRTYELQIQRFEIKKIIDLKKIFTEFTKTELIFHTKTIEMLTEMYKNIISIDEDKDLNQFCSYFGFSQINSPKREDSMKTTEESKSETLSPLRRFNSAPDFNDSKNSNSYDLNRNSKSIESIEEQIENEN